jgi:ATP-dependent RNA helicase RhlE
MVGAQKPASGIVQSVYPVAQARKAALLAKLLQREEMRAVLVFVKRKVDADRLARAVTRSGAPATSIHSDRRQEDRTAALEAFRRGQYRVLVATDVASRGIDVEGISHVVNFDVPHSSDDYIHRGGRTARAGSTGEVVTFVSPDEEVGLLAIEKAIGTVLPRVILPNFDHGRHEQVPPALERAAGGRRERSRRGGDRRGTRPRPSAEETRSPEPRKAAPDATDGERRKSQDAERPLPGAAPGTSRRRRRRPAR